MDKDPVLNKYCQQLPLEDWLVGTSENPVGKALIYHRRAKSVLYALVVPGTHATYILPIPREMAVHEFTGILSSSIKNEWDVIRLHGQATTAALYDDLRGFQFAYAALTQQDPVQERRQSE